LLSKRQDAVFREAAHQNLPLSGYIVQQLHLAEEAGIKDEEWAVGQYRIAQPVAGSTSGKPGNAGFDIR
jgi:hypothetical protein